jgi:hypothetical protein
VLKAGPLAHGLVMGPIQRHKAESGNYVDLRDQRIG